LWEILTREEPFAQYTSFDKFKDAVCVRHERPEIPNDTVPSLKELITMCWDPEPSKRPSFKEIITRLDDIIVDVAISDEEGRNFWKKNFLKREEVLWTEFFDPFSKYMAVPKNDLFEINNKCLHAVLAEKPKKENAVEIVNIEQFGKVLDWFGPLEKHNGSETILDRIRKLLMKQWFHGDVSTNEAQVRLSGFPNGTFLVRFSTTHPGCYTISSLTQNATNIKHQRVSFVPGKGFNNNGQWYNSIDEIIRESENLFIPAPGSRYQSLFVDQQPTMGYT